MGTMLPFVNHRTKVPVIIAKKYRYQCTMYVPRVMNTNLLHLHDPGFGTAREWKDDDFSSIVYMIQYGYLNSNVDTSE